MLNITSRIAVRIRNLPQWEVNWGDMSPQQPWQQLTVEDFMPSADDAGELKQRALYYMMKFLVSEFTSLSDLSQFVPAKTSIHPVTADEVVPMTVLLKDEKYIAETIEILATLAEDANLNVDPQVITTVQCCGCE